MGDAGAAELGDARVSSHIGQQLVADIELVMLDDPAAPVAVRLASPEVYRGAGIALPPVLSNLNLTVMRRDGRQFLHVTSLRPLDAEHLHLYLELTDKGQRAVRLATLWLTPDPNPAPPPAPVPVPVPAPAAAAAAVQASVAAAAAPARGPAPLPAPALVPALRPAARSTAAPTAAPAAADPSAAPSAPVLAKAAAQPPAERRKPLPALPIHKPAAPAALHAAGQPTACTPGEAQACSALGEKNAALRAQLATLEDKVKGLQKILGVTPAAAPAAAPVAETHKADAAKTVAAKSGEHENGEHKADEHKAEPPGADGHKAEAPTSGEPKAEEHQPDSHEPDAAPTEARPPAPRPAPPAGPKPISSIKPLVPHKPKTPLPEQGGAPWGWIGAGIALLAAAATAAFVLKRRSRGAATPAADGLLGMLKARLASRGKAPSPPAGTPAKVVEPTME
ncbi:FimV/HubP-related protein [Massilia phyllosphaerae]|uniref:FimV/HubP-related protein n=1 Tax=Massilia phyllosphaerae TaxID=3106034 RepID=UPI002B1CDD63|nr:hypothetical protein [Massilia sp. SGZ-792]